MNFRPKMNFRRKKSRQGSVLLLILGMLALLSLLGTALIYLSRQEEKSSVQYMESTRAEFAAESGIETALAKLSAYNNSLCDLPKQLETVPNNPALPLKFLSQSSFGEKDLNGDGLKECAGVVSSTYVENGDFFKLRVESCQSKLNINDTNSPMNIDTDPFEDQWTPERDYMTIPEHLRYPTDPNDPSKDRDPDWIYPDQAEYKTEDALVPGKPYPKAQGRLWTIVKELTDILFPDTATPSASPTLGEKTATAIFKARKQNLNDRFNGFHEIKDALVPNILNNEQYNLLESHFTLHSWQDENVLRPTFQWRINTPPVITPSVTGMAPSSHITDYVGDCTAAWGFPDPWQNWIERPCPRPGSTHPGMRGADMMDSVSFDFDHTGIVEADETLRHDRDIYIFSDMQTRYFTLEARSPINVNDCPLELLMALIKPIQGWYLQEAPATWRGEDIRSRAEDWDQPSQFMYRYLYGFPFTWNLHSGIFVQANGDRQFTWLFGGPDKSQYYYYDSYSRHYQSNWASNTPEGWALWQAGINPPWNQYSPAEKNGRFGELQQSQNLNVDALGSPGICIAELLARRVHDRIHNADLNGDGGPDFNPFQTWEEFEEFVLDLADRDVLDAIHLNGDLRDFDIYMAHALIANFNPNARLNDFNPDKRGFLFVDKAQLCGYSAELCFYPMGPMDIECLGRVMGDAGSIKAQSSIRCLARVFENYRLSTQEQFMRGYDNTVNFSASAWLGKSQGPVPTAGADFVAGNAIGAFNGCALQSYPEPEITLMNHISESVFDGSLKLATLQAERRELFAGSGLDQNANNCLLINGNRTLSAAHAGGNENCVADNREEFWIWDSWKFTLGDMDRVIGRDEYPPSYGGAWGTTWWDMLPDLTAQVPANNPASRRLCKPLNKIYAGDKTADSPGNLLPDGLLSDTGRTPMYESPNNLGSSDNDPSGSPVSGRVGSVAFWVKPNFDVSHANRIRNLFTAPPRLGDPGAPDFETFPWHYPSKTCGNADLTLTTPESWPEGNMGGYDSNRELTLYYFSRGGKRVVNGPNGRLDDSFYVSYHPDSLFNDDGRWIPTRSLLFMNGEWCDVYRAMWDTPFSSSRVGDAPGLGTCSVNQSWREAGDIPTVEHNFNLESHQWSHMALSWNWLGDYAGAGAGWAGGDYVPAGGRYFHMAVNGQPVLEDREQRPTERPEWAVRGLSNCPFQFGWGNFGTEWYPLRNGIHHTYSGHPNYLRFGETSSALWKNCVSDSTYDDFVSSKLQHDDPNLCVEYSYGRYYAESGADYTSSELDILWGLQPQSGGLMLHAINWTGYWPLPANANVAANHPRFNDNLSAGTSDFYNSVIGLIPSDFKYNPNGKADPMSAKWGANYAPFSVDVFDPASRKWRYEDAGVGAIEMPNYAGGSIDPDWQANPLRWEKARGDKLRFRVHFNIAEGQTLFTSPIFDDITFVFKMDQPKILYWEKE